jgi:hypothetical protein
MYRFSSIALKQIKEYKGSTIELLREVVFFFGVFFTVAKILLKKID